MSSSQFCFNNLVSLHLFKNQSKVLLGGKLEDLQQFVVDFKAYQSLDTSFVTTEAKVSELRNFILPQFSSSSLVALCMSMPRG